MVRKQSWKPQVQWWNDLEPHPKVLLVIAILTVIIGLAQLWFDWYGMISDDDPPSTVSTVTSITGETSATFGAGSSTSSSTSLPEQQFDFEPPLHLSGAHTSEGTSSVFFDEGLTVRIGQIDDETTVARSVTAFLPGQAECRWLDVSGVRKLIYRVGSREYEITIDLPSTFYAEVRVAKRIAGEPTGTVPCEPETGVG